MNEYIISVKGKDAIRFLESFQTKHGNIENAEVVLIGGVSLDAKGIDSLVELADGLEVDIDLNEQEGA
ncbi:MULTISPECIES: hypothetical protein [Bacillati]|uniref:hypothetical protein n=1 Tax=Bacillati TaxID=1783272 RepID=UPI0033A1F224